MAGDEECAQQYSLTTGFHEETEACAGDLSLAQSPCYGDSGGPLFVHDAGRAPLLLGVVSRGPACGVVPTHSVYARTGGPTCGPGVESKLPKVAATAPAAPPPPAVSVHAPAARRVPAENMTSWFQDDRFRSFVREGSSIVSSSGGS